MKTGVWLILWYLAPFKKREFPEAHWDDRAALRSMFANTSWVKEEDIAVEATSETMISFLEAFNSS